MARRPFRRVEKNLAGRLRLLTDEATSIRMARVRQRDTTPELLVRRACSGLGMHYRTRNRDLPGSPDLANRSKRWAIFVHGCYWHRHPKCRRVTTPKTNVQFWTAKFQRNKERDTTALRALQNMGYKVLVVWECEAELEVLLQRKLRAWQGKINSTLGGTHRGTR